MNNKVDINYLKWLMFLTNGLEKHNNKLRIRWMRVNKKLTVLYKTGKLIQRLKK